MIQPGLHEILPPPLGIRLSFSRANVLQSADLHADWGAPKWKPLTRDVIRIRLPEPFDYQVNIFIAAKQIVPVNIYKEIHAKMCRGIEIALEHILLIAAEYCPALSIREFYKLRIFRTCCSTKYAQIG